MIYIFGILCVLPIRIECISPFNSSKALFLPICSICIICLVVTMSGYSVNVFSLVNIIYLSFLSKVLDRLRYLSYNIDRRGNSQRAPPSLFVVIIFRQRRIDTARRIKFKDRSSKYCNIRWATILLTILIHCKCNVSCIKLFFLSAR